MQKGREKVSKQEFLDGLIDGKWAKGISNYTFSNKRINTKYCDLCRRYKDVIRYDWVFFYCQEIIQEYLEKTVTKKEKRDYLVVAEEKNKDGKYNDDISRIIFRMDKQINNKIDKHRNTYTRNGEKVDTWTVSFHDKLHPKSNKTYEDIISDENSRYFNHPLSEDEKEEGYRRFYEILDKAKLTKRQMEIIEILDKTEINFKQNKMYNQNQAAEMLGCSKQNVNECWNKIQEKIKATYKIDDIREMKLKKYEDFLDGVKTEKDVISFILKNLNNDDIEYMLYEVKSDLRQYFITNFISRYNKDMINNKKTRKFCRYFLKELIDYIDLIKNNIAISKKKVDLVSPIYIEGKDGANYFF